jgi:hypothetical protein
MTAALASRPDTIVVAFADPNLFIFVLRQRVLPLALIPELS